MAHYREPQLFVASAYSISNEVRSEIILLWNPDPNVPKLLSTYNIGLQ